GRAAVMLGGVMTVAIVTAAVPEKHITASWHGLLEFFYLPEVLLFLLLAWLIFAGPGRASLDAWFSARRSRRIDLSSLATAEAATRHQVQRQAARPSESRTTSLEFPSSAGQEGGKEHISGSRAAPPQNDLRPARPL